MNASRRPESTPAAESPPLEAVPGPVAHQRIETRWLGVPARFLLLCLGCAAFGAAIGLFATGNWGWGIVLLLLATVFLGAMAEAVRQVGRLWGEHPQRLAAEGRAHAATAAEVWRTRLESSVTGWRGRSRLDQLELDRTPALLSLGEAVWRGDAEAERQARQRLEELERERRRLEEELAAQRAGAEEKIRLARLPVQETMMVAPNEPAEPYPPPGEGDPPQPAEVPEPYPPPDEGTPPAPAPDPGRSEDE
jgi:hypothetical protein